MQDETLSQPLPLPRPRRTLTTVLVALLAFALGGGVVGWLVASGRVPAALTGAPRPAASAAASPATPQPALRVQAPAGDLGSVETRLALLEDRLTRIDGEANAASGNAARAEALLIAYAARRRIDKGERLDFVENQLKLRFGGAQPQAVQTVVDAARQPVTLADLAGQLEAAAPALAGTTREESTWTRARREIASLFVVRRAPVPAATPASRIARARLMLASGKVDEAVAEVERLPGADGAQDWIAAAHRYAEVQRALDVIETTAMLEPRTLSDGTGRPVLQPSPLERGNDVPPGAASPTP